MKIKKDNKKLTFTFEDVTLGKLFKELFSYRLNPIYLCHLLVRMYYWRLIGQ